DLWGGVATDVAGMLIPIGIASKAAKAAEIGSKAAKSASLASKLTKPKVIQTVASGVHGAVSAGVGNVKQQFYEKGSLEAIDWGEVAGKSTVSGIVGAGTGAVGAGISSKATSWLSNRAITSSLLNSESAVTRVAANFAVGSVSEVGAGVGTRFVGGILTNGGNIKEAAAQAINPQSILFDAALGGAISGVQGLKKPQQSYADLMSPEDAAKYRQFLEHGSTSGFTSPELKAFDKVDEALLMKRIDYDEVLAARKSAITNSDGTISGVQGIKKPQQSFADLMSPEDAVRYKNWLKVREGEMSTDYIHAGEELGSKLKTDGYKIIKTETANAANADWYDMGFDKPPIAENTIAYTVEAGNHSYSRVFLEGYNNPMSSFIVRTDEISGLSAEEIAQKLALSKVPNRIVSVDLPPSTPLEVSIVGPQPDWGTIGGDIQFAIKDVDLNPMWFSNIEELN
ncbi:MAG: hypothetical protein U0L42_00830, partial [Methanobrevibacter sp.]|uniref:hypothetical protein n=1 Tax=Methanobrevibacter sp. TaxID=66852 RepID=UPI002E7A3EC9